MRILPIMAALFIAGALTVFADMRDAWYTEGNNAHTTRIEITLVNTLDIERTDCPITIPRETLPIRDIHEMAITVVDPSLPARPTPPDSVLKWQGGHNIREETNGQQLFYQCDDLNKDGVWDELFFITNLKPHERKKMYLYIGFNQRGWNPHTTHGAIGSYCHHLIPVWESEHVGWKLWYAETCDVYGKREPQLMSTELYMKNRNGYGVDYDDGSDIMRVADTFGGGAICLFEHAAYPDSVSRPRFAPYEGERTSNNNWNEGPLSDTRYAYDVIVNGPAQEHYPGKNHELGQRQRHIQPGAVLYRLHAPELLNLHGEIRHLPSAQCGNFIWMRHTEKRDGVRQLRERQCRHIIR